MSPGRWFVRGVLVLLLLLACGVLVARAPWIRKGWIERPARMAALAAVPNEVVGWPPRTGRGFPDVALTDHRGEPFAFSELRGRPVLVELVAMTCAGCQAWSGGRDHGGFGGLAVQADLLPIEDYYREYTGGLDLWSGEIAFVHLVVYDTALRPPSSAALAAWRTHFGLDRHANTRVVTGGAPLANGDSFRAIPGFLLLDAEGVVRFDALGHTPPDNLYTDLLPAVPALLGR